jgi:nucleotide sugar dehydrogenase
VPTPIDEKNYPDLSPLCKAAESIAKVLDDNQLVVIESTIYPGTCEEIIKPILDKAGKKYYLAHCPERINPGDKNWTLANTQRVVGGIDKESVDMAAEIYQSLIDAKIYKGASIRAVEAVKILENTFRDINIAFVNEMAQSFYRMGIDVKEVIDLASTKPFAFIPHYPGVGVGGHCIAVDPYYMIEKGRASGFDHEFLKLARKINSNMPLYTVYLTQNMLNKLNLSVKGTKIGIYGLAYKPNVKDDRESPSYSVIRKLQEREADLIIYDPFLPNKSTVKSLEEFLDASNAIIIATSHKEIISVDYSLFKKYAIKLIIDGRNCLDKDKIKKLGILYRGIGRE